MHDCFACKYFYIPHTYATLVVQKKALNSQELELWMVMNHHVGAGKPKLGSLQEPQVLRYLSTQRHSPFLKKKLR